jgi:hypothetical protein
LVQPADSPQKPATLIPQYRPLLPKKSRSSHQQEFPKVVNIPSKFKEPNGEEYAIMLAEKLPLMEETPQEDLPAADPNKRDSQEKRRRSSNPNHPMRRATDFIKPNPGSVLAQAASGTAAPEDEVSTEHQLAATLPVEQSVVTADGRMDNHRTPIISVHGKDIDEHQLGKNVA